MIGPLSEAPSGITRSLAWRLHIDPVLLLGLVAVCALGLVVLYSAGGGDLDAVIRQAIRLGVACGVMLLVAQLPPAWFYRWSPWLYGLGVVLLGAVLMFGDIGKGAQRWLDLGIIRFQPSELMKLGVPMLLAWLLAERPLPPQAGVLLAAAAFVLVPVLLIAKQPDLGTALLIACAGFFVLFLAGLGWRIMTVFALIIGACAPLIWYFMHDYQRQRVITFLNPEQDPLGAGYHIIQSKIAIGSGGLYGKGWLNGTQSHLEFLPERSTDFIFAVYAEEFGLVGILLMLALYLFVLTRSVFIATQAQDTYTRLLAGTLALTFFVYIIVNVGMVIGLFPVVGLPLPLISFGGTSMVTLMAGFGMLMSIHTHRKLLRT